MANILDKTKLNPLQATEKRVLLINRLLITDYNTSEKEIEQITN